MRYVNTGTLRNHIAISTKTASFKPSKSVQSVCLNKTSFSFYIHYEICGTVQFQIPVFIYNTLFQLYEWVYVYSLKTQDKFFVFHLMAI